LSVIHFSYSTLNKAQLICHIKIKFLSVQERFAHTMKAGNHIQRILERRGHCQSNPTGRYAKGRFEHHVEVFTGFVYPNAISNSLNY